MFFYLSLLHLPSLLPTTIFRVYAYIFASLSNNDAMDPMSACFLLSNMEKEKENKKPVDSGSHWQDALESHDNPESHDNLRVDTNQRNDPPISPTVSLLTDLGFEVKSPTAQPGNAFALMKLPDAYGNKLPPRKSTGEPHASDPYPPVMSTLSLHQPECISSASANMNHSHYRKLGIKYLQ
ncbi:hypothetical protein N7478_013073 [Penicillium angulare]|uniref:uncharacterized protein n=1 Tax=Penicillium angulare TaxID=116970 RepID=UPI0025422DB2|nr:uncharacterized protein N7478_013073 [Penicillium angulare]KAJ5256969.1 hypothetical protein N7478_013073 [Penicillium angulare]